MTAANARRRFLDSMSREQLLIFIEILERSNAELQEQLREAKLGFVNILSESPSELYH